MSPTDLLWIYTKFLVDQRWLFTHAFKGCFIHWAHRKFALVAGHVILKDMGKVCRQNTTKFELSAYFLGCPTYCDIML